MNPKARAEPRETPPRAITLRCLLLLAALLASGARAGDLGRLFFTPEQRAQLDYQHAHVRSAENGSPPVLTMNGIVRKRGGGRTVWINGVARKADAGAEPETDEELVAVPGEAQPVRIKVGQRLLLAGPAPERVQGHGR